MLSLFLRGRNVVVLWCCCLNLQTDLVSSSLCCGNGQVVRAESIAEVQTEECRYAVVGFKTLYMSGVFWWPYFPRRYYTNHGTGTLCYRFKASIQSWNYALLSHLLAMWFSQSSKNRAESKTGNIVFLCVRRAGRRLVLARSTGMSWMCPEDCRRVLRGAYCMGNDSGNNILYIYILTIHSGRLTWNLNTTGLQRKVVFQRSIFRFHVNFPGCV